MTEKTGKQRNEVNRFANGLETEVGHVEKGKPQQTDSDSRPSFLLVAVGSAGCLTSLNLLLLHPSRSAPKTMGVKRKESEGVSLAHTQPAYRKFSPLKAEQS